jgi:hypothetical protein
VSCRSASHPSWLICQCGVTVLNGVGRGSLWRPKGSRLSVCSPLCHRASRQLEYGSRIASALLCNQASGYSTAIASQSQSRMPKVAHRRSSNADRSFQPAAQRFQLGLQGQALCASMTARCRKADRAGRLCGRGVSIWMAQRIRTILRGDTKDR